MTPSAFARVNEDRHQCLLREVRQERLIDQARPPGERGLPRGQRSAMPLLAIVLLVVAAVAGRVS